MKGVGRLRKYRYPIGMVVEFEEASRKATRITKRQKSILETLASGKSSSAQKLGCIRRLQIVYWSLETITGAAELKLMSVR